MDNTQQSPPNERSQHQINGSGPRRSQTLNSPISQQQLHQLPVQYVLTVHKDSSGYGMKVSGDKPVFVESVKHGGASMKAGLHAGDMILKVNGVSVQSFSHTDVVKQIKLSPNVELTVQRSNRMQRPSSIPVGPPTPQLQRGKITAPIPVDQAKKLEMEFSKMQTLRLMLDQEKKNLENLETSNDSNQQERTRAEATIQKLEEQLKQDSSTEKSSYPIPSPNIILLANQIQSTPPHVTPPFLYRFPRSLSSLSLGTKKKPSDKENQSGGSPSAQNTPVKTEEPPPGYTPPHVVNTPSKKKSTGSDSKTKTRDIPPPLPQRNPPKKSEKNQQDEVMLRRDSTSNINDAKIISDLDNSVGSPMSSSNNLNISSQSAEKLPSSGKNKKRSKTKTKALSDPKMSSQAFIEMESNEYLRAEPPPLPPRQPGMLEENLKNYNKTSSTNKSSSSFNRPLPNSIDTIMNYPLIATCTPVRDNMFDAAAFPFSHRPNIVQHFKQQQQQQQHQQQQQQQQHFLHHHHSTSSSSSVKNSTMMTGGSQQLSSKHRRVLSSPESFQNDRMNKSTSWDLTEKDAEETPPGTPPPPYISRLTADGVSIQNTPTYDEAMMNSFESSSPNTSGVVTPILAAQTNIAQKPIISMEDDEMSDQEGFIDEHGPFRSLNKLLEPENTAHLAIFLNFVLSNSDPSALLFYLITGLYMEGTVKDMKKWAYEIHSTFLVPRAPLLWSNVDEPLARDVDNVLQNEFDKGEILRGIFWKSRCRAKELINVQLQEFQVKRIAGLGTMYGPKDQDLLEARGDKNKEQKIVEEYLMPKLQAMIEEIDKDTPNECPKKSAMCAALSTVLHRIFVTRPYPGSPIDKVNHFVSREKSFKSRIMGKNRKMTVRGHHLSLRQYYEVTHCNHCQNIIWGVSPQGFFCTDCELNVHRACTKVLEENCPGPAPTKKVKDQHHTDNNKIRNFVGNFIRPTNHFIQMERTKRLDEEGNFDDLVERTSSNVSVVRQPSDRRPDSNVSNTSIGSYSSNSILPSSMLSSDMTASNLGDSTDNCPQDGEQNESSSKSKSPGLVNRSESYKDRISQKRRVNNRRKTSDPSLSKVTNDEQVELGLSNANLTQSSNSSLSSSLESTSTSIETVGVPTAGAGTVAPTRQWIDSDDENAGEINESDWSSNVDADILKTLSDNEKKRQEVINEIYITERSHVRTLRLLDRIFMKPLKESNVLTPDHLQLLFPLPALFTLKEVHSSFESKLKQRRNDTSQVVNCVGDIITEMFDGRSGETIKENAAQFCSRQQIALEALKEKRRKDETLQKLLTKQESHQACRRLQLKDLLPTVLQRLTKYPLLFESLYKITVKVLPDDENEADAIKRALESSRQILDHVNQAVRIAEDSHKLQTMQKKLDKSSYDKEATNEFKNIDLTQYKLIHDGPLIMQKQPGIQLHGLLFENMMVLLQKQDDRYILKYHSCPSTGTGDSKSEIRFNPITKIHLLLVRQSAVDKNAFFLINTNVSQMLEFKAPSSSECKTWFKHISDAAEAYKARTRDQNHDSTEDAPQPSLNPTRDSCETTTSDQSQPPPLPIITNEQSQNNNNNNNIYSNVEQDENNTTLESGGPTDYIYENKDILQNNNISHDANDDDAEDEISLGQQNSNDTRTLMQQCSLVAPSEVHVNENSALTAEPVITPAERLRRLDEQIRSNLAEKQRLVCDMFRVPNEHFAAIADIAGQPEASKEPADIALSTFAQIQALSQLLNEYITVTTHQEISAVSTTLCDTCYQNEKGNQIAKSYEKQHSPSPESTSNNVPNIIEDEDGYCEIEDVRSVIDPPEKSRDVINEEENRAHGAASDVDEIKIEVSAMTEWTDATEQIADIETHSDVLENAELAAESATPSYMEINDAYDSTSQVFELIPDDESTLKSFQDTQRFVEPNKVDLCGTNRLAHVAKLVPSVPCHLIAGIATVLNDHISRLMPKLEERDIEVLNLKRENQTLRELLNAMHEQKKVSESEETGPLSENVINTLSDKETQTSKTSSASVESE